MIASAYAQKTPGLGGEPTSNKEEKPHGFTITGLGWPS